MKLFICPKTECDENHTPTTIENNGCDHQVNHYHKPNCEIVKGFGYCPSCVEVEDFIDEEEM